MNIRFYHNENIQFFNTCPMTSTTQSMPKQILVLKPQNFLTFICPPASLIDKNYVEENKSFRGIAGDELGSKTGDKHLLKIFVLVLIS